jgi:hypothetical protein
VTNLCTAGEEGESRRIFKEIMGENIPNLMKYTNINIQEDVYLELQVRGTPRDAHWDML